jgi:hypothetical protein
MTKIKIYSDIAQIPTSTELKRKDGRTVVFPAITTSHVQLVEVEDILKNLSGIGSIEQLNKFIKELQKESKRIDDIGLLGIFDGVEDII